ncbi:MAG: PQQ-binding-like beta-propeller repeat protein [Planctomycetaceae bacterium]|nr:PQQ-binding-like beta-propeller repeat protein [Planctomycetales bacterium]MCB9938476.1 PQQ-binding-like beta-propeller repeat protein [Planctomycetaceae bacterium]
MVRPTFFAIVFITSAFLSTASAENWSGWRGPRGDGSSLEASVPTIWDGATGKNIRWKVPIAGEGHASPIIWNDRIFVVSCLPDEQERVLICLDRADGKLLWQKDVVSAPLETKHSLNSFASGTPATDGELVYVSFLQVDGRTVPAPNVGTPRPITPGEMVVAAFDFEGNRKWLVKPGSFVSAHGFCSSPVLYKDSVIVNGDHDGDSYIVALDRKTGETLWKVDRPHQTRSYVTPIIRDVAGRTQMVISGSKHIASYDPATGKRHWEIDGPTEQFVASMVFDGNLFFMTAGFPDYHVMGIRPDGAGDVTDSHVAWHQTSARCYVPSPVVLDGYLIVADDRGTANCFDAKTGETLWKERIGKHFSASLVHANGLAYLVADDGVTTILRPGAKLDVVAENSLGEFSFASPAISDGQLFIRGEKHLYCIEEQLATGG